MYFSTLLTPIGELTLVGDEQGVASIDFSASPTEAERNDVLFREPVAQLEDYFSGKRRIVDFDIRFAPHSTPFMRKVWTALTEIPYGETRSYGELADAVGRPRAARAVGLANNRNPLPIRIPCHRVVGHDGKLVGYRGGLTTKRHLLALERNGRG